MGFVTAKEVANGLNLKRFGVLGTAIGAGVMKITKINKLNKIYDDRSHLDGFDFLDSSLKHLEIDFEIPEKDLKRIPKTGPFISISNHPLGGIDGMILLHTFIQKRDDYKVIANFLLHRLTPLKPYIMPVNPFETRKDIKSSLSGLKEAIQHLKDGNCLGIFPAGEVSTQKEENSIVDREWLPEAMKLIQKSGVPVVPVYFHAKNSASFYRLSKLNDSLRTAKLPGEMLSQNTEK